MTDHEHAPGELEDHDLGLSHDLPQIVERNRRAGLGRRGLLGLGIGVGAVALVGCADDTSSSGTTSASPSTASSSGGGPGGAPPGGGSGGGGAESDVDVAEGEIPEETAGPFPGDGSNGVNVLTESGVVRSDLTSSFGSASGVAAGVPVQVKLRVFDLAGDEAAPLAGAAVYLWHCDREGNYSMYSEAVAAENYLRGVQGTDDQGRLEFTTVFPGCYSGRWPHMHFEVYESLESATSYTNKLRTSQLALPEDVSAEVYANAEGYDASVANLAAVSLDSDGIFADGYSLQMSTVTGSVDEGYTIMLNVPV